MTNSAISAVEDTLSAAAVAGIDHHREQKCGRQADEVGAKQPAHEPAARPFDLGR